MKKITLRDIIDKEKLTQFLIEKTESNMTDLTKFSDKARNIAKLLRKSNLGCQFSDVWDLCELLIDEKLPEGTQYFAKQGSIIILIDNPNEHNYELNTPIMVFDISSSMFNCYQL